MIDLKSRSLYSALCFKHVRFSFFHGTQTLIQGKVHAARFGAIQIIVNQKLQKVSALRGG